MTLVAADDLADPVPAGRLAIATVWTWAAMKTILGLLFVRLLVAVHGGTTPLLPLFGLLLAWLSLLSLAVYVAAGVLSLRWLHRAAAIAHAASGRATTAPGWAVGWFFVPIANFWRPFGAVREAWQVSRDKEEWFDVPVPPLLRWWWALWIGCSCIAIGISLGRTSHSMPVGARMAMLALEAALAVGAAFAWTRIIDRIGGRLSALLERARAAA